MVEELVTSVVERGDLAHLALFLWGATGTLLGFALVRELSLSNQRFSDFVAEIAKLNHQLEDLAG